MSDPSDPYLEETPVKTVLTKLGIRSRTVGGATLQTKGDIIATLVERDRFLRSLDSSCGCSDEQHVQLHRPLLREAG